MNQIFNK